MKLLTLPTVQERRGGARENHDDCSITRPRRAVTHLVGFLMFASIAASGSGAARPQFTSGVDLVEVYATVTDARGEPVTGLTAGDFHLLEDGEPQAISAFAAGEFPLSVAIALSYA